MRWWTGSPSGVRPVPDADRGRGDRTLVEADHRQWLRIGGASRGRVLDPDPPATGRRSPRDDDVPAGVEEEAGARRAGPPSHARRPSGARAPCRSRPCRAGVTGTRTDRGRSRSAATGSGRAAFAVVSEQAGAVFPDALEDVEDGGVEPPGGDASRAIHERERLPQAPGDPDDAFRPGQSVERRQLAVRTEPRQGPIDGVELGADQVPRRIAGRTPGIGRPVRAGRTAVSADPERAARVGYGRIAAGLLARDRIRVQLRVHPVVAISGPRPGLSSWWTVACATRPRRRARACSRSGA